MLDPGRISGPGVEKRPKSFYLRFQAELPNDCWQSDFTHYQLTQDGAADGPTGGISLPASKDEGEATLPAS
ncbi:MAG TPA: hypothetical protein VGM53_30755 [Streptosporangiaceae bacterium]